VIVAGPTSSHLLRSHETSVHTPGFKCFVRTFRPLFMFGHWETEIVECHSMTGVRSRNFARFHHRHGAGLHKAHAVHDSFCEEINKSGQSGSNLARACSDAYYSLWEQNVVDGWAEPTGHELERPQVSSREASTPHTPTPPLLGRTH
jgi:hypothetical protein